MTYPKKKAYTTMKHSKKKKKKPQPPKQVSVKGAAREEDSEECRILKGLMEAFASVSLEEAASAYREANGDSDKAAEILGGLVERSDDQVTCCSSSSGSAGTSSSSGSSSAELFMGNNGGLNGIHGRGLKTKQKKKIVAATGTVSTVLGKEYVMSSPRKDSSKQNGYTKGHPSKEDAGEFLYSVLGGESELSIAVVRDVLCQCGFNVEKALNALLELSSPSYGQFKSSQSCEQTANKKEYTQSHLDYNDTSTDRASDTTSHSSESELQDVWSTRYCYRNYTEVLTGSEVHSPTAPRMSESELPQQVLESLFNMPKSSEREPNTMNWRDVAKKMASLGPRFESDPTDVVDSDRTHAKRDDYLVFRKAASQHWDSMKSYYQKAAAAFSNGERSYAAYLSQQGRSHNRLAQEADEKASQEIFRSRNKNIGNVITIDLHGQHVKPAVRLLKLHLLFGVYVRSVQVFRVITGCGNHGVGKSKLKQSVINLIEREGIDWSEENRGTILIKLDGQREFSFLESQSDSE